MDQNFIEDNIVILSKQTLDLFLKEKNPSELISLYVFYYYTAKWQKTNQIKCTTAYASNGLHWNKDKVKKTKSQLMGFGLVEDFKHVDAKTKKIKGWYIKLNYIWKKETIIENVEINSHPTQFPASGESQRVESKVTNALSVNNINALNASKEIIAEENSAPCLHQIIVNCFYESYKTLYNEKLILTKKELGVIKNIRELFEKNYDDPEREFYNKFEIFKKKLASREKFWRDVKCLPTIFLSQINSFVEETPRYLPAASVPPREF